MSEKIEQEKVENVEPKWVKPRLIYISGQEGVEAQPAYGMGYDGAMYPSSYSIQTAS